jgi:hypothetical protein
MAPIFRILPIAFIHSTADDSASKHFVLRNPVNPSIGVIGVQTISHAVKGGRCIGGGSGYWPLTGCA